jgi:GT2 family glycosyltransferase
MASSSPVQPQQPDLSIVIVSWNVRDLLHACLRALERDRRTVDMEVIVVDGGSGDGSANMVSQTFHWVDLIALDENVGFPRGNNIGLARADGRYVMLLNPDAETLPGALGRMVRFMDEHPDVGAVGPQLLNPDHSVQSSRRRFPTLRTAFVESTWLQPYAPAQALRHYYALDLPDNATADVDWVVGAALAVRGEVLSEVGNLDEGYFMYSEELDWCRRIKDAGWRVIYYPAAQIVHHVGKSSEQAVTARHIHFQRAKLRYFRKYHGVAAASLLRLFLLASYAWQLLVELAKWLLGHRRELRRQRIAAYWQVLRSGLPAAGYR